MEMRECVEGSSKYLWDGCDAGPLVEVFAQPLGWHVNKHVNACPMEVRWLRNSKGFEM